MKRLLSVVLTMCFLAPSVYAAWPTNPKDCCYYCPNHEQEFCFWNSDSYLFMSIEPDTVGYYCGGMVIIQDGKQYDNFKDIKENGEWVCGKIYVYTEIILSVSGYSLPGSPYDPNKPMTVVNEGCNDRFLEYPDECSGNITTTAPKTTTSTSLITTSTILSTTTTTTSSPCTAKVLYGEHSEEVEILRFLRDEILNQTPEGQELIHLYYKWSPVIVKMMEEDEAFRKDVKEMADEVLELIVEEVE